MSLHPSSCTLKMQADRTHQNRLSSFAGNYYFVTCTLFSVVVPCFTLATIVSSHETYQTIYRHPVFAFNTTRRHSCRFPQSFAEARVNNCVKMAWLTSKALLPYRGVVSKGTAPLSTLCSGTIKTHLEGGYMINANANKRGNSWCVAMQGEGCRAGMGQITSRGRLFGTSARTMESEEGPLSEKELRDVESLKSAKPFCLPQLKFGYADLEDSMSTETVQIHYGRHHATYVRNLNAIVKDNPAFKGVSLEDIIVASPPGPTFNNSGQIYNHNFFWNSLTSKNKNKAQNSPHGEIAQLIEKQFGDFGSFKETFKKKAVGHFGSGWVWLVADKKSHALSIVESHDANSPLNLHPNTHPLLVIDVWEHAYYLDHQNKRPAYVDAWFSLVDWDFANENLRKLTSI